MRNPWQTTELSLVQQYFKNYKDLGISTWERSGLIETMKLLRGDKVKNGNVIDLGDPRNRVGCIFDMGVAAHKYDECGTVACVGGWVWLLAKEKVNRNGAYTSLKTGNADGYVARNWGNDHTLYQLYYPEISAHNWNEITPKRAAWAIHNFLLSGKPHWKLAMNYTSVRPGQ